MIVGSQAYHMYILQDDGQISIYIYIYCGNGSKEVCEAMCFMGSGPCNNFVVRSVCLGRK